MGVRYEYRKCRECNGTGRVVRGERIVDAAFSFGFTALSDLIAGEDVITEECPRCDGYGEVRCVVEETP